MKALSELSTKEKQKLAIAGGLFAVAAVVMIVTMSRRGGTGVPRDAQAAQEKILQQMQGETPPPAESDTGATPPAPNQPAGRARSVHPGK